MTQAEGKTEGILRTASSISRRAIMILPFVAVFAFAFDQTLSKIGSYLGLADIAVPSATLIDRQLDFVRDCKFLGNIFDRLPCTSALADRLSPFDFELFRLLVWIALILGALRIVIGILDLPSLDWYSDALRKGKSVTGFLAFFTWIGLFGTLESLNFEYVSSSHTAQYLIEHSPRVFLTFHSFLFCSTTAFLAEGVLFVIWIVVRRSRSRSSNMAGGTNG